LLAIAPALLLLLFAAQPAAEVWPDVQAELKRFTEVYSVVEQEAADPVDSYKAIYGGAIPGMLKRLDPHSVFFDPDQFAQLKELEKATQKGFGSVVSILPGRVIVLQTLPGTPSARSGIEPGDEILAVNGIRLDRLGVEQLVSLLGQSRRRRVKLDVRRPGSAKLLQFVMIPAEVQAPSVDLKCFLRAGVGYVRATSFEANTGQLIRQAIEDLGGDNLKALVLDLRNNPGGLMAAALATAALFLEPGKVLVSVRGRQGKTEELKVPDNARPYRFPMAVLVNERSASASEIVAGALQDHDRAVIVGVPSFGKGLVQSVFPLSDGAGLALTTAFYYTPSGRSIQKPLPAGQLHDVPPPRRSAAAEDYHTDSGRPVRGRGGIHPDVVVHPEPMTRLRMVLDASASFTSFATETLRKLGTVTGDFQVSDSLLDDFQVYLAQRGIQPGVAEWSTEREWIRSRLKQEIFYQSLGVARGDEVELERDPQVHKALAALRDRFNSGKPKPSDQ